MAAPEEYVEVDVKVSMPAQKYYGILFHETMFSNSVTSTIHDIFDRHFEFLKLQREHGAEDIFIKADVPYFATKNYWDDPEFVGTNPNTNRKNSLLARKLFVVKMAGFVLQLFLFQILRRKYPICYSATIQGVSISEH